MDNDSESPFNEEKWGALRYGAAKVERIRERIEQALDLFERVFKDTKTGLEFIRQAGPGSIGVVKSPFGEAQLRVGWAFKPKGANTQHEELVARIVAVVSDPFDLSDRPRTLPPIWELLVPEYDDWTVVVDGRTSPIPTNAGFRLADYVFVAGMALNRAIAEARG